MRPSDADYAEWLAMPVTEYVLKALTTMAEAQATLWAEKAWEGNLDPVFLNEARTRADCYRAMAECTLDDWSAVNDPEA